MNNCPKLFHAMSAKRGINFLKYLFDQLAILRKICNSFLLLGFFILMMVTLSGSLNTSLALICFEADIMLFGSTHRVSAQCHHIYNKSSN